MKKTLLRLAALAMALVLCIGLLPAVNATETTQPQETEAPSEHQEGGFDWSFMLTAVLLALASVLHMRNQKRRSAQRR